MKSAQHWNHSTDYFLLASAEGNYGKVEWKKTSSIPKSCLYVPTSLWAKKIKQKDIIEKEIAKKEKDCPPLTQQPLLNGSVKNNVSLRIFLVEVLILHSKTSNTHQYWLICKIFRLCPPALVYTFRPS